MLREQDAVATVAVKNLDSARTFYEQTLGLRKVMENDDVLTFKSGTSTLFVYRSQYAGTNKATAVTWVTDEVEDIVETLKGRGVRFELTPHYQGHRRPSGDVLLHSVAERWKIDAFEQGLALAGQDRRHREGASRRVARPADPR